MKRFPLLGFLGLAGLGAALPAGPAMAQLGTIPDVARGVTVTNRPRPDYAPLGVHLGGFRLDGFAELGPGLDSNIFGRRRGVKADGFTEEAVGLAVESQWTRHVLGLSANFDSRQHFRNSGLDYQDFDVGGFGRYDFSAVTSLEGGFRHYRDHLDVYSADVQAAGFSRPVPFTSDEAVVTARTRLNRIGLVANGAYRTYRFEDTVIAGQPQRLSQNDFASAAGNFGASYTFVPGRTVTALLRLQDIRYDNVAARARDSFTWEALFGFEYDLDGVWQGRLAVGWQQREYDGPLKALQGPAIQGQLTWLPTQLTTVRFNLARTIEESIRQDAVSYQRTRAGITLDHEYLRNVILSADARLDRREYDRPSQTITDAVFTLSARWLLNRGVALIGSYSHSARLEATGGIEKYDRNLVQVRLRFSL